MAIEIPTVEPTKVVAGDYIQWRKAENPERTIADGWVLSYALVISGKNIDIQCADNGDKTHLATITVTISNNLPAGIYHWQSYITKADERYLVDSGTLKILVNFAALDGGHDGRTFWRTVLDNVEAVIKGRATKDQSSYTVNGRQLSRTPIADLLTLYDKAKTNVSGEEAAEAQKKGLGGSNNIFVRFS